jgi:hypothetical protein
VRVRARGVGCTRLQILEEAKAGTANLGTLLRNVIIKDHLELSRGVFVYLRARRLLAANLQPEPSAREISAKRKREAHAKAVKASEFNSDGEFIDSLDRRLVIRTKRGSRYFYEHTPVRLPYHYILGDAYRKPDSGPDKWCGDYFLDSYEEPILFRSRSFSEPSLIEYHRVVSADKLVAVAERNDAEYARLVEDDEQRVHDDAEDSEAEAEAKAERDKEEEEEWERAKKAKAEAEAVAEAEPDSESEAEEGEVVTTDREALSQTGRAFDLRTRRIYADKPVEASQP